MQRRAPLALAAALALAGCSSGLTLDIDLRTDLAPVTEMTSVAVAVDHGAAQTRDVVAGTEWERGTRIGEFEGLAHGSHTVEVSVFAGARLVTLRRVVLTITNDYVLTVVVTHDCADVTCPRAGDPPGATTCVGGTCADPHCGGTDTASCPAVCHSDLDCPAARVSCATVHCENGSCLDEPDSTLCTAPGAPYCDLAAGCVAGPGTYDAGPQDLGAPPPDLGTDGGPPPVDLGVDAGPPPGGLWILARPYTSWTEVSRGDGDPFAPTSPVEEAFSLDGCDRAYVVTHTTYHVMRTSDRAWIESGLRDTLFPQLSGRTIGFMVGVGNAARSCTPADTFSVLVRAGADAFVYDTMGASGVMTYSTTVPNVWASDPRAPAVGEAAGFFRFNDPEGWAVGDPHAVCPAMAPAGATPVPYSAVIAADAVYLQDDGYCGTFVSQTPYTSFAPFAKPGAPAFADVGAAFFADHALWVMRP